MTTKSDIFELINNAVLDLQASQHQTFERPLKQLAKLLDDPLLEKVNKSLTEGIDIDDFLKASERSGGMMGSAKLNWPDDSKKYLGMNLCLIKKLSDNPRFALTFAHEFFYSGSKIIAGIHTLTRQLIIPFVRDYKNYVLTEGSMAVTLPKTKTDKIFIVHGHDVAAREMVARFISNIGLSPIILHEQANRGRTVIEKVESNSDVSFAVVLLTPDDLGKSKDEEILEPRARQNVLLELGYFIGKLGRGNVCALKRGEVEIPSDFAGVVWERMDDGNGWKQSLGRELEAAGHSIDWNKVMKS